MSGHPSRTTAEVLTDPRHADLIRQADDLFAAAERTFDLAESFDLFAQAVAVLRKIDTAEDALWQQRQSRPNLPLWEAPELRRLPGPPEAIGPDDVPY